MCDVLGATHCGYRARTSALAFGFSMPQALSAAQYCPQEGKGGKPLLGKEKQFNK